jgi:hypothetical protein
MNPSTTNRGRNGTYNPGSTVRTSLTHPLRIDQVPAGDKDGLIGITFCPGKHDWASGGFRWERSLQIDLDVISQWKPAAMVTLIEDHEFARLGVEGLGAEALARGLNWHHMPITDVQPPDARFEAEWAEQGGSLLEALRSGSRVLVHCRGGLGRAGTVAARMLVELGCSGKDAVDLVRRRRPGAIETDEQEDYVLSLGGDIGRQDGRSHCK